MIESQPFPYSCFGHYLNDFGTLAMNAHTHNLLGNSLHTYKQSLTTGNY